MTSTDISNGYFTTTYDIQYILRPQLEGRGLLWEYGGDNKIRIIDSSFGTHTFTNFAYRAKYVRFKGSVKDQDDMDLPRDLELPVVMYAYTLYMDSKGLVNAEDDSGFLKRKRELDMEVEFGIDGSYFSGTLKDIRKRATQMMRGGIFGQNQFVSVSL